MNNYAFIDGLRGLAALWVCLAHCFIWSGWVEFFPDPKLAVDLFMMISGFLMMAQAAARQHSEPLTQPRHWWRFYARRFFRIAPAYYLSLALAVVSQSWFLGGYAALRDRIPSMWVAPHLDARAVEYSFSNILAHLSFVFGLHPAASFSTFLPDWSLSLEMQFYLLFPLIFLVIERWGWVRSTLIAGLVGVVVTHFYKQGLKEGWLGAEMVFREPSLIFFKLQLFLVGVAVFALMQSKHALMRWAGLGAVWLLCWMELATGAERFTLFLMAMTMLFLARSSHPLVLQALRWPWVHRLSTSAYAVYLFHGFFIALYGYGVYAQPGWVSAEAQAWLQTPWAMIGFVVPAVYVLAYGVERWVEQPGILLGKKLIALRP